MRFIRKKVLCMSVYCLKNLIEKQIPPPNIYHLSTVKFETLTVSSGWLSYRIWCGGRIYIWYLLQFNNSLQDVWKTILSVRNASIMFESMYVITIISHDKMSFDKLFNDYNSSKVALLLRLFVCPITKYKSTNYVICHPLKTTA